MLMKMIILMVSLKISCNRKAQKQFMGIFQITENKLKRKFHNFHLLLETLTIYKAKVILLDYITCTLILKLMCKIINALKQHSFP